VVARRISATRSAASLLISGACSAEGCDDRPEPFRLDPQHGTSLDAIQRERRSREDDLAAANDPVTRAEALNESEQ
jgi:hypothetical protein